MDKGGGGGGSRGLKGSGGAGRFLEHLGVLMGGLGIIMGEVLGRTGISLRETPRAAEGTLGSPQWGQR